MELKRLQPDVIEKIRSSFSINTVPQCVTELVLNSLDAKSTAIAVRLNLVTFKIQVVDNGDGILEENMRLLGSRYFTNKCKGLEDLEKYANYYGFRGEAIASIVECSKTVNITSRHQNTGNTYSRTLGRHSGGELSHAKSRPSVGTTVTIEGFFHNFPVRRKRVIVELELEEIKRGIEGLVILHPRVTFSVRNDAKCELILNSQKSDDLISSFKQLHPNLGDDFSMMKISKNKLTIDALVYKSMSEKKNLQYISVNKRPIFSSKIQKLVGGLFKKNQKVDRKNPIAAMKKYPVFVMNIKCPISKVDILLNPTKTMVEFENWDLLQRCINKLIDSFFGKGRGLKKKEKFITEELKKDCGVSQIVGACRRFGYKRKNSADEDIIKTQTIENDNNDFDDNPLLETGNEGDTLFKKYDRKNNSKKISQNVEENERESICISDATSFEGNFRGKNKFKKPLPITVGKIKVPKNNAMPEKQDDMKSSISKFTDDQNKGKNLIMDMFLKSTQIYNSDENLDKLSGGSQETIYEEESNFQLENNYQTKFKGMSNTMSVSVNVKSRRKIRKRKKRPENLSKYVQTEFVDEKLVSRAVQTRIDDKSKKKLRINGLKKLGSARHSNNFTVVLSDNGENGDFKFVMKNSGADGVEPNIKFDVSQKCHCNCHGGKNKIFDFKEQTNNLLNENICIPQIGSTEDQLFKKQKHLQEEQYISHINQYNSNRHYLENCDFDVERRKEKRAFQNYERSPYFAPNKYSENNLVRYEQHPPYPMEHFKPYSNLQYPVQLDRNILAYEPPQPPPYYIFQNDARLVENERPNFLRQDNSNNPNDWTVGTFGQFRPARLSTQKDEKGEWKNSSFRNLQPHSETIREWTINSFGQFKPFLLSTQKDEENNIPEQKQMLFTPSPVEQGNPLLYSLINLLDRSQDIRDEAMENCVSSNEDDKIKPDEKNQENIELDNSKLNTMKDQDTLEKELEAEKSLLAKEFLNWDSQFTQDIGNDWLKKFNKCGNSYYLNKKTGFTTFQTPKLVENQFKFGKRYDFMPKGMSPILTETKQIDKSLSQHSKDILLEYIMETYKNELLYVKWQNYLSDVDPDTFFQNIYKEKLKMFEQCIPDFRIKNNKIMDNVISFSKDLFTNIEVIGQLDKKFIITLENKSNLLIIFDQHAAHERIRLEELFKKYHGAKSECDEKMVFFISHNDLSLLKNHESYLEYLGITVEFFGNGVNVSTVPLCLSSKFKDNNFSNTLNKMIQLLIKQIIDHLKSTRGVHLKSLPKLLQNVVNLEACRGAIKFGDSLTKKKCKELLVQLSSCDLPFQCAHGRPTLAPLVMLELNEKIVNCKPNFHKLKQISNESIIFR